MGYNDSHLSQGDKEGKETAVRQHHRLARGESVDGKTNPNGGKASTDNKIGNDRKTY
jgi:hypothetical protein